jgi:hypothetical protein
MEPMGIRVLRHVAIALVLLACAAACSPLPNPNPTSPANQLNGVGSPNQLPIGTPNPSR